MATTIVRRDEGEREVGCGGEPAGRVDGPVSHDHQMKQPENKCKRQQL